MGFQLRLDILPASQRLLWSELSQVPAEFTLYGGRRRDGFEPTEMRALPHNAELEAVAGRTVWFKPPADAIAMPVHFIAHVLKFGTHEDVTTLRKFISDDELKEAVEHAPPGIFDARSWAYWNLKIGRYPAPPLPVRKL